MPQLLRLKSMLQNKRSLHSEKPTHHKEEQPPLTATRESWHPATKTQSNQKEITFFNFKKVMD